MVGHLAPLLGKKHAFLKVVRSLLNTVLQVACSVSSAHLAFVELGDDKGYVWLVQGIGWTIFAKGIKQGVTATDGRGQTSPSPSLPTFRADTFLHSSAA